MPVTLESGKAIGAPRQEVLVRFRPTPHAYPQFGDVGANTLRLAFEDSAVELGLNAAAPDRVGEVTRLALSGTGAGPRWSAYGWVMHWLLDNNRAFSVAGRAAEEGWRIVQPALDAIAAGQIPIRDYPAGTTDPLG